MNSDELDEVRSRPVPYPPSPGACHAVKPCYPVSSNPHFIRQIAWPALHLLLPLGLPVRDPSEPITLRASARHHKGVRVCACPFARRTFYLDELDVHALCASSPIANSSQIAFQSMLRALYLFGSFVFSQKNVGSASSRARAPPWDWRRNPSLNRGPRWKRRLRAPWRPNCFSSPAPVSCCPSRQPRGPGAC